MLDIELVEVREKAMRLAIEIYKEGLSKGLTIDELAEKILNFLIK